MKKAFSSRGRAENYNCSDTPPFYLHFWMAQRTAICHLRLQSVSLKHVASTAVEICCIQSLIREFLWKLYLYFGPWLLARLKQKSKKKRELIHFIDGNIRRTCWSKFFYDVINNFMVLNAKLNYFPITISKNVPLNRCRGIVSGTWRGLRGRWGRRPLCFLPPRDVCCLSMTRLSWVDCRRFSTRDR